MANGATNNNAGSRTGQLGEALQSSDPATLLMLLQLAQSAQQQNQVSPNVGTTSPANVMFSGAPGAVSGVGPQTLGGLPFTPNAGASVIRGLQALANNARAGRRFQRQQRQGDARQAALVKALLQLAQQGGEGERGLGRLSAAGQGRTRTDRGFDLPASRSNDRTRRG